MHRLLALWRHARTGAEAPTLDAVYAQPLHDMVPHMVVLELAPAGRDPVVRLVGAAFRSTSRPDAEGRPVSSVAERTLLGRAVSHWREALERDVPITQGGSFSNGDGRTWLYRSVILPISDDGQAVTHLLCAANGKIVPADAATASTVSAEP